MKVGLPEAVTNFGLTSKYLADNETKVQRQTNNYRIGGRGRSASPRHLVARFLVLRWRAAHARPYKSRNNSRLGTR